MWLTNSVRRPGVTTIQRDNTITTTSSSTVIPGITYVYSASPWPSADPTPRPPGPPPPPGFPPSLSVSIGAPRPTCTVRGRCGQLCESNCDVELPCIGICGCIGLGCPGGSTCVGPGCSGSDGNDPEDPDDPRTCEPDDISTVSSCRVACSVSPDGGVFTTAYYTTSCATRVGCDIEGTTTDSNTRVGCPALTPAPEWATDPDQPIPTGGISVSDSWTTPAGPFTAVHPADDTLPGDDPNAPEPTPGPEDPEDPDDPQDPPPPGQRLWVSTYITSTSFWTSTNGGSCIVPLTDLRGTCATERTTETVQMMIPTVISWERRESSRGLLGRMENTR